MISSISKLSDFTYRRIAKPLLFKQSPDAVHTRLLRQGRTLQKSSLVRHILSTSWAYQNEKVLSQDIAGIHFRNPVGLSAGFDKNFELIPLLKAIGFGFMEGGSVTFQMCEGNPRPWFHRLPNTKSLVVYAGLANDGVKPIVARIQSYPTEWVDDFPLNISVAKTNSKQAATEKEAITDYIGSMQHIKNKKVGNLLTINISCPNTYGGEPFTTPPKLERLLTAVDALQLQLPVFVKMPSNLPWQEFNELLAVAATHTITGVTISNLAKDRGQITLMDPLPDSVKGNLSGKPTWDLSNELIRQTYTHYRKRFVIIGVGGIFSAEDAYTKIKLGASLVELITGMIFEGPQLIGQINQGLEKLVAQDGYQHISEAIGVSVTHTSTN